MQKYSEGGSEASITELDTINKSFLANKSRGNREARMPSRTIIENPGDYEIEEGFYRKKESGYQVGQPIIEPKTDNPIRLMPRRSQTAFGLQDSIKDSTEKGILQDPTQAGIPSNENSEAENDLYGNTLDDLPQSNTNLRSEVKLKLQSFGDTIPENKNINDTSPHEESSDGENTLTKVKKFC